MSDDSVESEQDDIVTEARKLYKRDKEAWAEVYDRAKEDLFFLSDDECAQWIEKEYSERIKTGRPALTIDQLGQFVHQVVNDIRQNTPDIKIIPGDETADDETAEAFQSIIRGIEYKSKADVAYDTAASFSVKSSIGFIRIDHKYSNNYNFDQELSINRVINPLSILIDSDSIELDGCDIQHGHALEKMSVTAFKKRWPGKEVSCYDSDQQKFTDKDHIYVAEFFKIEEEKKTIKDDKGKISLAKDDEKPEGRTREVAKKKVMRYWLSGKEVLETSTFPGKYIPIVPVYGEEAWQDGKRHLLSLIRKSKGAQMMFNLWKSLETEMLLKQPIAPVMAPAGAIENYKDDWLNPTKSMALRYDQADDEGTPYNRPERLNPPTIPTGIVNAARETVDDIKATLGMYSSVSNGKRFNATSGIQEKVQLQQGDTATYHFGDNLRISINHVGCIIVNAAPEIYDTDRVLMGINGEDEPQQIGINGKMAAGQKAAIDLATGQYEVRVVTGPSFTTQRQETTAALQALFQQQPELISIYGDLYFKNSDFAGSDAMAERAKKLIQKTNPELIEGEDGQEAPNPQVLQLQQVIQQGAQVLQQAQAQAQQATQEAAQAKQQLDAQKMQDALNAQADGLASQQKIAQLTIQAQEKDLEIQVLKAKSDIQDGMSETNTDIIIAKMNNETKIIEAVIKAQAQLHGEPVNEVGPSQDDKMQQLIAVVTQQLGQTLGGVTEANSQLINTMVQAMSRPKDIIRDENGNITRVQ